LTTRWKTLLKKKGDGERLEGVGNRWEALFAIGEASYMRFSEEGGEKSNIKWGEKRRGRLTGGIKTILGTVKKNLIKKGDKSLHFVLIAKDR